MMQATTVDTYTTLDGRVLDLTGLSASERAFLDEIRRAYTENQSWSAVASIVTSAASPVLAPTSGLITRAAWEHPLFQATLDLADRVGIRQGELAAEGGIDRDPFEDTWVPASEAAASKNVARTTLHLALRRGDIVARPIEPGSKRLVVSGNSLARWNPNQRRQAAGRKIAASRHYTTNVARLAGKSRTLAVNRGAR